MRTVRANCQLQRLDLVAGHADAGGRDILRRDVILKDLDDRIDRPDHEALVNGADAGLHATDLPGS